jgi:UDP-glucose 4-epimerase
VVYHLAAQVSVPRSVEDPVASHRATETSTLSVLHAAERAGVRRVVLASSSAVYGDRPGQPKKEAQEPAPASPYAVAKLCSEIHARHWAEQRGLQSVSLRFFNVYGPRQDPKSPYAAAIPIFVSNLMAEHPVPIFGDGKQTRDFTFVEDVVQGILAAGDTVGISGRVYNVASGRGTTVLELVETLAQLLGVRAQLELLPPRPGDIKHSRADISAATRDLRFSPRMGLKPGLQRTIDWFKKSAAPPSRRSA